MMDEKNYFDGPGEKPMEKKAMPEKSEDMGDEGVTTHTHKKGDKFHSKVDKHDGFPADDMEHDTMADASAAHAQALEEKYGEEQGEKAEEEVSPGVHEKAGEYMKHMMAK